jgi:hypothetical protein
MRQRKKPDIYLEAQLKLSLLVSSSGKKKRFMIFIQQGHQSQKLSFFSMSGSRRMCLPAQSKWRSTIVSKFWEEAKEDVHSTETSKPKVCLLVSKFWEEAKRMRDACSNRIIKTEVILVLLILGKRKKVTTACSTGSSNQKSSCLSQVLRKGRMPALLNKKTKTKGILAVSKSRRSLKEDTYIANRIIKPEVLLYCLKV